MQYVTHCTLFKVHTKLATVSSSNMWQACMLFLDRVQEDFERTRQVMGLGQSKATELPTTLQSS